MKKFHAIEVKIMSCTVGALYSWEMRIRKINELGEIANLERTFSIILNLIHQPQNSSKII